MRYLGGKATIARKLTAAINREVGATTPCWEPFMGAGHMTAQLARTRRGEASDVHRPLMAMWGALEKGWIPPRQVSRDQYEAARLLPDSDPLKAFAGFGCAFGGKWFDVYAADLDKVDTRWRLGQRKPFQVLFRSYSGEAHRTVRRVSAAIRHWELSCGSFFDRIPDAHHLHKFIYADPPYAGTTAYSTGPFDTDAFWARCVEWARYMPVLVSEYVCPVPHRVLYAAPRSQTLSNRAVDKRASDDATAPVERLFRVLPQ